MDEKTVLKLICSMIGNEDKTLEPDLIDHGFCIVVIASGFVFAGKCKTDQKWVTIENARPVIRWGTSKGLTELANNGPQTNAKLGEQQQSVNKTPIDKLINIIPCAGEW